MRGGISSHAYDSKNEKITRPFEEPPFSLKSEKNRINNSEKNIKIFTMATTIFAVFKKIADFLDITVDFLVNADTEDKVSTINELPVIVNSFWSIRALLFLLFN